MYGKLEMIKRFSKEKDRAVRRIGSNREKVTGIWRKTA
jgi:hypothetical protein